MAGLGGNVTLTKPW